MDRQQIYAIETFLEKRLKGKIYVVSHPDYDNGIVINFIKGDFFYHKLVKYENFESLITYDIDYVVREIIEQYLSDTILQDLDLVRVKIRHR